MLIPLLVHFVQAQFIVLEESGGRRQRITVG